MQPAPLTDPSAFNIFKQKAVSFILGILGEILQIVTFLHIQYFVLCPNLKTQFSQKQALAKTGFKISGTEHLICTHPIIQYNASVASA
jgi:hypothetical protein